MLQLLKNNNPFTVLMLLIFTLIIKLQVLMHPIAAVPIPGYFVYNYVLSLFNVIINGRAFGFTILAVLMQFGQGIYINRIAAHHKLFSRPTYIPAYTYLLCTAIHPVFGYFSITLLAMWFVLFGFDILLHMNQTPNPRKLIFNAGFLLAIGAILQFSMIGYLLMLLTAVLMLRSFNIGEWVVSLLGYFTPIYFFACILFLADKLELIKQWPHIGLFLPHHIDHRLYWGGTISGMLILFLCGWYATQSHMPKSSVYIRRNWLVVSLYLIISILVAVGSEMKLESGLLVFIPALSLVIAHAFSMEKSKRFSNFAFYLSILLIIFCQLTINK